MRVRVWVSIVSSQLCWSWAAMGAVPANPLALQYDAPEHCPAIETFSAAVTRLVGSGPRVSRSITATVTVRTEKDGQFVLTLLTELDGIPGERILRGTSCDSVVDAATMTLALLLNPDAQTKLEPEPVRETSDQTSPVSVRPTPLPNATRDVPTSITRAMQPAAMSSEPANRNATGKTLQFVTGASLGLDLKVMPQASPELSLAAGLGYGRWSTLAAFSYAPPANVYLPTDNAVGGRLWHGTLMAIACGSLPAKPPRMGTCLGAAYTWVQGRGIGVANGRRGTTNWISPAIGVFGELPLLHRFSVMASATLLIPANRPDAHLDDMGTVQRPAALTGKLHAGVMIEIP